MNTLFKVSRFIEVLLRTILMTCILMACSMLFIGLIRLIEGHSIEQVQQMVSVSSKTIALFFVTLIPGYICQKVLV